MLKTGLKKKQIASLKNLANLVLLYVTVHRE
jgi:hypothetical protein